MNDLKTLNKRKQKKKFIFETFISFGFDFDLGFFLKKKINQEYIKIQYKKISETCYNPIKHTRNVSFYCNIQSEIKMAHKLTCILEQIKKILKKKENKISNYKFKENMNL